MDASRLVFFLGLTLAMNGLLAQLPNDSLYRQLITDILTENQGPFQQIEGIPQSNFTVDSLLDSTSKSRLTILSAEVTYRKWHKDSFVRQVAVPYQIDSDQLASFSLSVQDTLSRRQLRRVMRHSSLPLRGQDPRKWVRIVRPITWIGAPLVLSLILFGWRTQ